MKTSKWSLLLILFSFTIIISACTLPAKFTYPTPTESIIIPTNPILEWTATPQVIVPTVTPWVITATPQPTVQAITNTPWIITATPVPASATPLPTNTPWIITATSAPTSAKTATHTQVVIPTATHTTTVPVTRISFASGATSATVAGSISAGGRTSYVAWAGKSQTMMVYLSASNATTYLEIQAPDGSWLVTASQKVVYWQGLLPANGDYLLSAVATGGVATYELTLTLPVRVGFKPGKDNATYTGTILPYNTNTYVLWAAKGQTMTVTVNATKHDVYLAIYGYSDGVYYLLDSAGLASYTFVLPTSHDYVVKLVSHGAVTESYTVYFEVK
jgi:hypothetical protein